MTKRHGVGLASVVCAQAFAGTVLLAQAQQRVVYVSALDTNGAPVADLAPTDVVVREDDVAREVIRVAPADEPMQIALLVDNSQEAEPHIRDMREALEAFITALTEQREPGARNELALITLADRPTIAQDFTFDRERLLSASKKLFATSGAAAYLLDAVFEISQGFMKRGAMRPVIVAVIGDGTDLSYRHYEQVRDPLRESGAAFHALVIGGPGDLGRERGMVLAEGTRWGGGRYENVLASMGLPARMKQLAEELTHQFRVTYGRPQTLIPPERVTVSSGKPGLTVRGIPAIEPPRREPPRGR
jgi:hypothetical protein